jgi:hypothetical protein
MSALYGQAVNPSGIRPYITGYVLIESSELAGAVDVRELIYSDYYAVTPGAPSNTFLSALVAPVTIITDFNELVIKTYGGEPTRYKFGTLNIRHENLNGQSYYIQYEQQTYPTYHCMVSPTPLGYPSTTADLPSFEEFTNILLSTLNTPSYPMTDFSPSLSMSALQFDLAPTVVANIGFFYTAYANYSLPAPSTLLLNVL